MKKNIALFTHDFYPFIGGMGRYVYEIYTRLKENTSFNFFVFSPSVNNLPNHFPIFSETQKTKFKNIDFSVKLNFNLKKIIEKYNINAAHFLGGPGGILLFKKLEIPTVYTACHTYYQQYRLIASQKWKWIFSKMEPACYKFSDKIICISKGTRDVLTKQYKINSDKIHIIPPGVDTGKFYPRENVDKLKNSILFVGRLDERKGIDFLIDAVPSIVREKPDTKIFVGGKGKLYNKLQRFVQKNNLAKNVEFLGFIPEEDLARWYNQVELVVVPSVFEGFGVTVIEAMACGTPVVATEVDGIRDSIENNENGILVKYGDKDDLAGQIIKLLENWELRLEFSRKGLETVKQKFDWDHIVKHISCLYQKF